MEYTKDLYYFLILWEKETNCDNQSRKFVNTYENYLNLIFLQIKISF